MQCRTPPVLCARPARRRESVRGKELTIQNVVAAKVRQAVDLLREHDMPVWIVQFARESYDHAQPVQGLMVGTSVTWPAAFLVAHDGSSTAIVGTGDVGNVESVGAYRDVVGYVKDVGPPLREVLSRLDPAKVGVSYSLDDDSADNISHGMFLLLQRCLEGTPYENRIVSAENVLGALRARKLPSEVELLRQSIDATRELFDLIEESLQPGITERSMAEIVHGRMRERGWESAWDSQYDPVVNFGPQTTFGHAGPGDRALEPSMLVHVDLGIKQYGYCSDLQRMWYALGEGEEQAPAEVRRAFDHVVRSMQAGFEALQPGVQGYEVDAVARRVLVEGGYDEPEFALGHQLGQSTHDGGALLGPRWPRYGSRPEMVVEEGNVFTLEYALPTSAGTIGLEEDVLVTASGAEYLSDPQTTLKYVRL